MLGYVRWFDDYAKAWGKRNDKQDQDLQAEVKRFFDVLRADLDSPLNRAWKGCTGLTLPRFIELVSLILVSLIKE